MGLADFDDAYESATVAEKKFTDLPDGRYQAVIEVCTLKTSQAGNPVIAFELAVINHPQFDGRKLFVNRSVTPKTLEYVKADLALLGFTGKLSALEDAEARMALTGIRVEVQRKTKGKDDQGRDNVNIYMNKRLDAGSDQAPF